MAEEPGNISLGLSQIKAITAAITRWEVRQLERSRSPAAKSWKKLSANTAARLVADLRKHKVLDQHEVWQPLLEEAARRCGLRPNNAIKFVDNVIELSDANEEGKLSWALAQADNHPLPEEFVPVRYRANAKFRRLASLACQLDIQRARRRKDWFPFGVVAMAAAIGVHRNTMTRWIAELDKAGIIRLKKGRNGRPIYHPSGTSYQARFAAPIRKIAPTPPVL